MRSITLRRQFWNTGIKIDLSQEIPSLLETILVPFSTLSNLSSVSPRPIRADCFIYGYVANNKPLGDLLIIKFKNNGSCNPTIELFTPLGIVLGIIPASGDPLKLGYDGLVFIKYIEIPSTTSVVH